MKNPYKNMRSEQLCEIIRDIQMSKREGKRIESFVPYAREIFDNLNGAVTSVPLSDCIQMAQADFYEALCERFLGIEHILLEIADDANLFRELDIAKAVILKQEEQLRCPTCLNPFKENDCGLQNCPRCNQKLEWGELNVAN